MPLPACSASTTNKVFGISPSDIVQRAATLAELRTLAESLDLTDSSVQQVAYLEARTTSGDGGEGIFRWNGNDLSAEVKKDTQSGIYVAPDSDLTGTSGAWVRLYGEAVNVHWFGAIGDGITNDTIAIQAALILALEIKLTRGKVYAVDGTLYIKHDNVLFDGNGATLIQKGYNKLEIINSDGRKNIEIFNCRFIGVGLNFVNNSARFHAIRAWDAYNINIHSNVFENFAGTSFSASSTTIIKFQKNIIVGPGRPTLTSIISSNCFGVSIDKYCSGTIISDNDISKVSQGIILGDKCQNIKIIGNTITNITGQHGLYLGAGLQNIVVSGNTIDSVDAIGLKIQNYDEAGANANNLIVSNNTIVNSGSQGIFVGSSTKNPTYKLYNVDISNNTIANTGENGILVNALMASSISNNNIRDSLKNGIFYKYCYATSFEGNIIYHAHFNGIYGASFNSNIDILNNKIIDVAIDNNSKAGEFGIFLAEATTHNIKGNTIIDSNGNMKYGLYYYSGSLINTSITNNFFSGSTDHSIRFINPPEDILSFFGNSLPNSVLYPPLNKASTFWDNNSQ
jgi:hypothetical protein